MRLFNKVAIVGVGLVGGSIALAIKNKGLAKEVIGVSRHKKTLLLAKRMGAIDKGALDLNIIRDADLVILATPVSAITKLAAKISKIVKKECLITDVGSTKQAIVSELERIFPNYVGSHPLAGSEKRGILNADPRILKDSLCIFTPTGNTNKAAQEKIARFWSMLGARVVYLTSGVHDRILSFVSHLPHLVAFSLIDTVPSSYLKFASAGLKDTTRVAASDSEIWSDIFLSNKNNILESIDIFQANLSKIKSAIQKKDKEQLISIFKLAKRKRESLNCLMFKV